jgi:hypothetical protein
MNMLTTVWATVRQGKIELLELKHLPEGARVLVTLMLDEDAEFWQQASNESLNAVWDNDYDNVDFLSYLASQDLANQEIEEPSTFDLMLVSESVLAKDWLKPEEDEAWQNL